MRKTSLLLTPFLALALAAFVPACGGDDDDNAGDNADNTDNNSDEPGDIDAGVVLPMIDAAPAGGSQLGESCTGSGQSTCAAGLECFTFNGAATGTCNKMCDGANPQAGQATCAAGFTGPQLPYCLIGVTTMEGQTEPSFYVCGLICEDLSGGQICPTCNGTCPAGMACSAELSQTQGGPAVAKACQ